MIITPTHASDRLRPTRYVPGIYVARAKIQWYFYLRSKIGYNHYSKQLRFTTKLFKSGDFETFHVIVSRVIIAHAQKQLLITQTSNFILTIE